MIRRVLLVIALCVCASASSWGASQTVVGSFVAPLARSLGGTGATDSAGIANVVGTTENIILSGTQAIAANTTVWSPSPCADGTLNLPASPVDNEPHTVINVGVCPSNSLTVAGNGHNIGLATSLVSTTAGSVNLRYSSASGAWEQGGVAGVVAAPGFTPLNAALNLSDVGNAATSRANLGLGTIATQDANAVAITGGTITGNSNLTGAIIPTGATIAGLTSSSVSADTILSYVFCTSACTPLPAEGGGNWDAVRGVGIANAGTTVPIVAGVSGYVLDNQAFSGSGPSSVALFGTGVANVDSSSVWGINTNVSDHQFRVAQAPGSHNRRVTGAEFDVSASYLDTNVTGILIAGNSVVQPTNSTAVAVVGQDFSAGTPGSIAKWSQAFYTFDGVATHFAFVGTETAASTTNSQDIQMGARISSTGYLGSLFFGTASFGSAVSPTFNTNYGFQVATGGITSRSSTDQIIQLAGKIDLGSGASIVSRSDDQLSLEPLEILAGSIYLNGTIQVNASGTPTSGASCPSGVTAGTVVVVSGIVTHC